MFILYTLCQPNPQDPDALRGRQPNRRAEGGKAARRSRGAFGAFRAVQIGFSVIRPTLLRSGPIDFLCAVWFTIHKTSGDRSDLYCLSDARMARPEPCLPTFHGKSRVDDRPVLSETIFINHNGLRWCDAPADYGPHKTLHTPAAGSMRRCAAQDDFRPGEQGRGRVLRRRSHRGLRGRVCGHGPSSPLREKQDKHDTFMDASRIRHCRSDQ